MSQISANSTVKTFDVSFLECPICFKSYSETDPTTLPCGHSCCLVDANQLHRCCICNYVWPEFYHHTVSITLRDIAQSILPSATKSNGVKGRLNASAPSFEFKPKPIKLSPKYSTAVPNGVMTNSIFGQPILISSSIPPIMMTPAQPSISLPPMMMSSAPPPIYYPSTLEGQPIMMMYPPPLRYGHQYPNSPFPMNDPYQNGSFYDFRK